MKRKKTLLILLLVLCFCVAGIIGVKSYEKHQDKIKNSGEVVLSFSLEDVTHIEWTYSKNEGHAFTKENDKWVYDGDEDFVVDSDILEDLIEPLTSYAADFVIDEPESLSSYGLTNSNYKVNITLSSGELFSITFGNYSSMDSERYFSLGDGKVYLAINDVMNNFYMAKMDFLKGDAIPEMENVLSFDIEGDNNLKLIYDDEGKGYTKNIKYYIVEGSNYKAIDNDLASDLIENISRLSLSECVSYAKNADLSSYNLKNPNLVVNLVYEDEDKTQQSFTAKLGFKNDNAYITVEGSNLIYEIATSKYEDLLNADYLSLRNTKLEEIDWEKVSKVQFTIDSAVYEIGVENNGKGTYTYKYKEENVDAGSIVSLLDSLEINVFTDDISNKKREVAIVVYQDSEDYPQISIDLYRYDGENCVAYFMGDLIGFVDRDTVVDIIEAVYDIGL